MNKAILTLMTILACFIPLASGVGGAHPTRADVVQTTFYGTVYDNVTGDPIPEASVAIFDRDYSTCTSTYTDMNGYYNIEFKKGGEYHFFINKAEYIEIEETINVRINEKTEMDFYMEPMDYESRIFGKITDIDTGVPIPNAYIDVYNVETAYDVFKTSDENGSYSIGLNAGSYYITCFFSGYDGFYGGPYNIKSGDELNLDIALELTNQGLFGYVKDESGNPVPNAGIYIEGDHFSISTYADTDGYYNVPMEESGDCTLSVTANGYKQYSKSLTIEDDEMLEVNVELQKSVTYPLFALINFILSLLGMI